MRIDDKLNVVFKVGDITVHHVPMPIDTVEDFAIELSATHDVLATRGIVLSGEKAVLGAFKQAVKRGVWNGDDNGEVRAKERTGLFVNELCRTTNIIKPVNGKYVDDMMGNIALTESERLEIVKSLLFFTVMRFMDTEHAAELLTGRWSRYTLTLLNVVEFIASLPTLTETVSIGVTVTDS